MNKTVEREQVSDILVQYKIILQLWCISLQWNDITNSNKSYQWYLLRSVCINKSILSLKHILNFGQLTEVLDKGVHLNKIVHRVKYKTFLSIFHVQVLLDLVNTLIHFIIQMLIHFETAEKAVYDVILQHFLVFVPP